MAYQLTVETLPQDEWRAILAQFDDARIYQTWHYGCERWGSGQIVHAVMRDGDMVIGAAQIVVKTLPMLKGGIAYAPWSPLVRKAGAGKIDVAAVTAFMQALREEFSVKRGLLLRVMPHAVRGLHDGVETALLAADFDINDDFKPYRTFSVDLTPSEDDIRKSFKKNWNGSLKRAERNELSMSVGKDKAHYDIFLRLYDVLMARKGFDTNVDVREFARIQAALPDDEKMMVFVTSLGDTPISAIVVAAHGDGGIYILGATDNAHMAANGSYFAHWHVIQWLKAAGFKEYELGGVDPDDNPNIYKFKQGMAGRNPEDVYFLGTYEICDNPVSAMAVRGVEALRAFKKKLKSYAR